MWRRWERQNTILWTEHQTEHHVSRKRTSTFKFRPPVGTANPGAQTAPAHSAVASGARVCLSGPVPGKPDPSETASITFKPEEHSGHSVETQFGRRDEIVIGRGVECDVVIKDAKASRRHCRLLRKPDGFLLEDLGSKNGTFVDGKKIAGEMFLKANQTFKIGDTVFYLSH